jgi:hypothetical protein
LIINSLQRKINAQDKVFKNAPPFIVTHVTKMQDQFNERNSNCSGSINIAVLTAAQADNWCLGHSVQSSLAQKIFFESRSILSLSFQLRHLIEMLVIEANKPEEKKKEKRNDKIKQNPLQRLVMRILVIIGDLLNKLTDLLDDAVTYQYLLLLNNKDIAYYTSDI